MESVKSSPVRDKIVELFGEPALRKSSIRIRGGAGVFERVMSGKGYRAALEIGTYRGVSAAEMAQYCERVITIDLRYGKLELNGETFDRHAFWSAIGVMNIELALVDDDAEKKALVDSLEFDVAFIDGAHDAAGVRFDFDLVKRCGRVLFHDAADNGHGRGNAVYEFLRTLPQEELEYIDIFAMWIAEPMNV